MTPEVTPQAPERCPGLAGIARDLESLDEGRLLGEPSGKALENLAGKAV